MPIKTYREAVKEALAQEMEHDERVVLIGEDLRGGHGGNAPEEARIELLAVCSESLKGCGRSSAPTG
ncbi:acetoin:DCPIP oxidoreductase beta subunit [Klebsiella grimontii]|nr:acetoin:DCPIP oxidoreductase beta subunit [Klebsiella grimontii]